MTLNQLTPRQLAYLTQTRVSDAKDIFTYIHYKKEGKKVPHGVEGEELYYPDLILISELENHLNIEIQSKVDDIYYNFTKRHATRGWVSDLPQVKINASKDGLPKK